MKSTLGCRLGEDNRATRFHSPRYSLSRRKTSDADQCLKYWGWGVGQCLLGGTELLISSIRHGLQEYRIRIPTSSATRHRKPFIICCLAVSTAEKFGEPVLGRCTLITWSLSARSMLCSGGSPAENYFLSKCAVASIPSSSSSVGCCGRTEMQESFPLSRRRRRNCMAWSWMRPVFGEVLSWVQAAKVAATCVLVCSRSWFPL